MKTNRLKRAENISSDDFPPLTPQQQLEDTEALLNELADIAAKLPPDDGKQTLKEILADFHRPRTTFIQTSDGKRLKVRDGVVTMLDAPDATQINVPVVTETDSPDVVFTDDELQILETLKDG